MPHHFIDRPRRHALLARHPSERRHLRWETVNAMVYLVGGLLFMWGSVLFFPALGDRQNRGVWIFIAGSALYLLVTAHDAIEVQKHRSRVAQPLSRLDRFEAVSTLSYLVGTVMFTAGSVFFLSHVDRVELGVWCFLLGCLLFMGGATIDALTVFNASGIRVLRLMNLTALSFVTGSLLFFVASIPYLWTVQTADDERKIDALAAGQYLCGSLLFFLGGIFNYLRLRSYVESRAA